MICKQHSCTSCGKDFKVGETKVAKCLVSEKAFCYDYDQEQLDTLKNVCKTLRKKRKREHERIKRKVYKKMQQPPPTPEQLQEIKMKEDENNPISDDSEDSK